jgi:hypothetical protein
MNSEKNNPGQTTDVPTEATQINLTVRLFTVYCLLFAE